MSGHDATHQERGSKLWARSRSVLEAAATLGILTVCLVILWDRGQRAEPSRTPPSAPARSAPAPLPEEPIDIGTAASRGAVSAPVGLLIFSDFQCPFCQRFATDTLPLIDSEYVARGKVRLLAMQFPLDRIHRQAFRAAQGAECARQQGRFWAYHDQLFAAPSALDDDSLMRRANDVGLDRQAFTACLAGGSAAEVRAGQELGARLGIAGTPGFIVGRFTPDGRLKATARVSGARPLPEFRAAFEVALTSDARPSSN
ncbi:MAG: thioredoxin domain-containing protein [Vicinamibacterales bacterium]